MKRTPIGRQQEIDLLNLVDASRSPQLVALYGRRRVGKTFLVRTVFDGHENYLEVTGQKGGDVKTQLGIFARAYSERFLNGAEIVFTSWAAAFDALHKKMLVDNSKFVVFFDELPWLVSKRSAFLEVLDHYWNTKFSQIENCKIILCGSAASWMLHKIIHAKGGLHNRLTRIIALEPFSLAHTKQFLESRNIGLPEDQVLDIYLAMGGIPFYLETVDPGLSATQVIQSTCFSKNGILFKEFESLFSSLFDDDREHAAIVQQLAGQRYGLSRDEILTKTRLSNNGSFSRALAELEASSFIRKYTPYAGSSRHAYYRLLDEYSLFYLKWIKPLKSSGLDIDQHYWLQHAVTQTYKIWAGYSFELTCLKHIGPIKKALGISGIKVLPATWRTPSVKSGAGAQIDLVLDRADNIVNLCEIKHFPAGLKLDRKLRQELQRKQGVFLDATKTRKGLSSVIINSGGFLEKPLADSVVSNFISGRDLFSAE